MRIAIAGMTSSEDAEISRRGARADCYLVFDESANLQEVIINPFKDYDRAVGVRVADYLAEKGIDVVAAGNLGTGFTTALDSKGIKYSESDGTIRSVAEDLRARFGSQ